MSRLFVPMTTATGIGRLPEILEQRVSAHAVQLAFQQAALPMDVIEFPNTKIPIQAIRDLFEISAHATGERCFGLSVGRNMVYGSFGLWMGYSAQGGTLGDGLRRSQATAIFHQSGSRVVFAPGTPISFWRYVAPSGFSTRPIHHCDHLIWPMIRFVRSYLGPDWMPEWIEVNYPRDGLARQLEAQLPVPVRFGAPAMGLAIKRCDLSRHTNAPVAANRAITFANVQAAELVGPTMEPLLSVFSTITLRLLDGQTDIDGVASALGVGVQHLQRKLRREGVDYRELLNRAKRQRAKDLLAETSLPIIDIALSLGYSDHANFSRAFKRMVGVSPVDYRTSQGQMARESAMLTPA